MTTLADHPITRETARSLRIQGKQRTLVVTLHPGYLEIRPKHLRHRFHVDYAAIYRLGATIEARQEGSKT